jgi:hypothetical protein
MTCLRALAFVALLHTDARTLRAALGAERDGGGGGATAAWGDDLEVGAAGGAGGAPGGAVDPLALQLRLLTRELTPRDYAALLALDEDGGGGHAVRGLTRAQLDALPPTHAAAGAAGGDVTCAVCLEEPAAGDTLRTLPCSHQARARAARRARFGTRVRTLALTRVPRAQFHAACVDTWLAHSEVCPVCKRHVLGEAGSGAGSGGSGSGGSGTQPAQP